jgi:Short repeat of unknown function (DUF308)
MASAPDRSGPSELQDQVADTESGDDAGASLLSLAAGVVALGLARHHRRRPDPLRGRVGVRDRPRRGRPRLPPGRAGGRARPVLTGLVSIALGVVLGIRPDLGAVSLATVFGLFSIVSGVNALVLSVQTRRADTTAERLVSSTT